LFFCTCYLLYFHFHPLSSIYSGKEIIFESKYHFTKTKFRVAMSLLIKVIERFVEPRFAIYIVFNNIKKYVLRGNSPVKMLGYVMGNFKNKNKPNDGWSLYFSSLATKKHFVINCDHFTIDGEDLNDSLLMDLDEVDVRWRHFKGGDLSFSNYETKEKLKMSNDDLRNIDLEKMMKDLKKSNVKEDWFDVMHKVFGK